MQQYYIKDQNEGFVKSVTKKEKRAKSPKLHVLSTLQAVVNLEVYSPANVLKLVQGLNEKKLVAYPRTDTQFIIDNEFAYLADNVERCQQIAGISFAIASTRPNKPVCGQFQGLKNYSKRVFFRKAPSHIGNLNRRCCDNRLSQRYQCYYEYKQNGYYEIQASILKGEWQKSKYLALYITQNVAKVSGAENGIQFYGEISRVEIIENLNSETQVRFHIHHWQTLKQAIRPVGYGIQTFIMTTFNVLSHAKDLPELFMKYGEEVKLWRMLRRLTTNVKTALDDKIVDHASKIQAYQIGYYFVVIDREQDEIHVMHDENILEQLPLDMLKRQPIHVFRVIKETIFK
ncbi:DNA topoisomerase [Lederbergia lenta]|uniref:5-methylcytosine-specific restriction related enzyme n=1 Tax=Lederbergia lenta TaxID=1467 RepID=A0A2X4W1V4_LEDLE|nr:DNA topoisomerase [Lederbergia lenta]MEC2323491.1 DNA topoisomerase [Lederbergia lenta]SQI52892.1 5-methylcytosine-specific restriction related enzyme [Lederbergia lenta]